MEKFELIAEPRTNVGKGASRRLRRENKVPGVVYGTEAAPVSVQFDHDDLVHHLENEAFYSHILTLTLNGKSEEVVLRDLQRHPYKPKLMHIDLQRISASEKIAMRVPVHILNANACPGVKDQKGIVNFLLTQVEIVCLPRDLPEYIEIDIVNFNIGDAVHLSELVLPKGVELEHPVTNPEDDQVVVTVQPPQAGGEGEETPSATPEAGPAGT